MFCFQCKFTFLKNLTRGFLIFVFYFFTSSLSLILSLFFKFVATLWLPTPVSMVKKGGNSENDKMFLCKWKLISK